MLDRGSTWHVPIVISYQSKVYTLCYTKKLQHYLVSWGCVVWEAGWNKQSILSFIYTYLILSKYFRNSSSTLLCVYVFNIKYSGHKITHGWTPCSMRKRWWVSANTQYIIIISFRKGNIVIVTHSFVTIKVSNSQSNHKRACLLHKRLLSSLQWSTLYTQQ